MTDEKDKKPTKVVAIRPNVVIEGDENKADEHVVSQIEELLELAKAGEITEIVWVAAGAKGFSLAMLGTSDYPHSMSSYLGSMHRIYDEDKIDPEVNAIFSPDED